MNESKITTRYAKALFDLSLEKGVSEIVALDMQTIISCNRLVPEFHQMLLNPVLKISEKNSIFSALFGSSFHAYSMSLLTLLVKNRRESFLPLIAYNFLNVFRLHHGYKSAILTSAFQLDEETISRFKTVMVKYFDTKVDLECKIDPDIIGGFIIQIDDKRVDASVSSKLKKLRKTLITSPKI